MSSINNPATVVREEGTSIVTRFIGQAFDVGSIEIHCVDFQIAVPERRKYDLLAVGSYCSLCVIAWSVGQPGWAGPIRVGAENVIAWIESPNIAARVIRSWRAFFSGKMSRRIQDSLAV